MAQGSTDLGCVCVRRQPLVEHALDVFATILVHILFSLSLADMFDNGIKAGDLARARIILRTASSERRGQWRSLSAPRAHATLHISK
jgi:hypothetical protein